MEEIIANEYNLNIPRYVDTSDPELEIDLDKVFADINKTNEEIAKVTADLNVFLKELGLQELK